MVEFYVEPNTTTIPLGRQGENLARTIYFELSELISNYGEGTATLVYLRSKDSAPYVCDTTQSGSMLSWTPTDTDTAYAGAGKCELRWVVGDVLAKSIVYRTSVTESITGDSTVPSEYESWYEALLEHISEYEIASDQIATNTSQIAANTSDIAVLDGRMDEFTTLTDGSTTGDAELADIRVGYDGTVYSNAGEAVRTQIADVKSALTTITKNECFTFTPKKAINTRNPSELALQTDNDTDCLMISCNAGDIFTVRGEGWASFALWAFYGELDGSTYPCLAISALNAKQDFVVITAPTNAKYLVMNVKRSPQTYAGFCCSGAYLQERLEALEEPIAFTRTAFFGRNHSENIFNRYDYDVGRLNSSGGIDTAATSYFTSKYIDLYGLTGTYVVPVMSSATNIGCSGYAFYDESKTFISGSDSSRSSPIQIPENARYFKVSYLLGSLYTFSVYVNSTQTGSDNKIYFDDYQIGRNNVALPGWYAGKSATALGDSITANGNANASGTHSAWGRKVAERLHLAGEIYNCGIGGSRVSGSADDAMWKDARINAIPTTSDLLFFNGGMNDWGANAPLGDEDSTDTDTFYGALNIVAKKLMNRVPNALIIWMTTTFGMYPNKTNDISLTTYDYGRAIKKVAEKHGFLCVDLHALCGWNQYNVGTFVNEETVGSNTVYIHPNENGGKKITTAICSVLEGYQPY